jgi:hypothetical protein
VKELPGRKFDGASKKWTVPANASAVEPLFKFYQQYDFEIDGTALNLMAALTEKRAERIESSRAADAEIEIVGLGGELRPFQKAGVKYALDTKRLFIADEMGLGKTIQALATIHAAQAYPAIIVCPASLKLNWAREAAKWLLGKSISVWNGKAGIAADIRALAAGLTDVLSDPARWQASARARGDLIIDRFRAETMVAEILALYRRLLRPENRRPCRPGRLSLL